MYRSLRTVAVVSSSGVAESRRHFRKDLFEGPLDLKPGERDARKGPPVAHSLPVYKSTHKLNNSIRWKNANLVANVAGGKDYRLRETQGEGHFDETGMYRDWLYGDERRYANYVGASMGLLALGLFFYTMKMMSTETWDLPAPVLAAQRKRVAKKDGEGGEAAGPTEEKQMREDALAMLKRPQTISKAS